MSSGIMYIVVTKTNKHRMPETVCLTLKTKEASEQVCVSWLQPEGKDAGTDGAAIPLIAPQCWPFYGAAIVNMCMTAAISKKMAIKKK